MKIFTTISCFIFCSALLAFGSSLPKIPDAKKVSKTPQSVKAGTAVYADKCQICHENSDITMKTKTYTQMMPMLASMVDMEKLSKKEIDQVAAYVYSVSKK